MAPCRTGLPRLTCSVFVIIRINPELEKKAFGRLIAENVPFKTWRNGETSLPEKALVVLEKAEIGFTVIGPATYEHLTPIRDLSASEV